MDLWITLTQYSLNNSYPELRQSKLCKGNLGSKDTQFMYNAARVEMIVHHTQNIAYGVSRHIFVSFVYHMAV
jgi:hypothetical protein